MRFPEQMVPCVALLLTRGIYSIVGCSRHGQCMLMSESPKFLCRQSRSRIQPSDYAGGWANPAEKRRRHPKATVQKWSDSSDGCISAQIGWATIRSVSLASKKGQYRRGPCSASTSIPSSADGAQGAVSTIVMHALMVREDQNVLNPSCYMVASTEERAIAGRCQYQVRQLETSIKIGYVVEVPRGALVCA